MKKIITVLAFMLGAVVSNAQYENTTIKVGQQAPDLAFADTSGNTLDLAKINKHRIVLVDFWASWCGPCRRTSPKVVELYKEYNHKKFNHAKKGFAIVSVSLDQKKEAWLQAIQKDHLNWPYHMSDLKGWQSKAAELYGVQFIPQSFLLDGDGKVIGKYASIEEAEADLKKLVK